VHHEFVRNEDELQQFLASYDHPGRALYWTVARIALPPEGESLVGVPGSQRCKDNVLDTHVLWAETDFKDHPDIPPDEIVQRVRSAQPSPSAIVLSGHGIHAYWLLQQREDASPGDGQRRIEEALKLACQHIGGDPHVTEVARLMRLPGSHNTRVQGERVPVRLEQLNGCKAYTLDELQDAWLAAAPILPTPSKMEPNNSQSGEHISEEWAGPLEADAELEAMRFKAPAPAPNIHQTQLRVSCKMISAGEPVAKVVASILAATKKAVANDPRCQNWDWAEEERQITTMCFGAINRGAKKGEDFSHTLSDDLYAKWRAIADRGELPCVFLNRAGAAVRTLTPRPKREGAGLNCGEIAGHNSTKADNVASVGKVEEAPQSGPQPAPRKVRFKLISFRDLRLGEELPYLVDEFIPSKGIVVAWGPPKCLKSFLMLSAMFHVAVGWEFHGRAVHQGAVVYCAFEGGHGYRKRKEALRRHHEVDEEEEIPLYVMPGMANLINDHGALIEDLRYQLKGVMPVAVVLDTLNKSFVGSESKDVDMSNYIRAAEAIRDAFQCVVIIVHHCGLDETRPRGHTSLPGAVDAQIAISREGMTVTAEVEFMRDGPEGTIVAGRGEIIPVGHDINGRELSSLVIEPIDGDGAPARQIRRKWGGALKVFHDSLTEALISSGVNSRGADSQGGRFGGGT